MVRYYGRARQITGTVFTNQPGLKQAGCPGTVGKRGTIVRFLGKRVNCNLKTCGLPISGLRCKYGVRQALGNMDWRAVESSNNPAISDYCHQAVNKWNGVHCRWPQPKNRQLAGGVGNIWTPRRNHCERTCSLGKEDKIMMRQPDGPVGSPTCTPPYCCGTEVGGPGDGLCVHVTGSTATVPLIQFIMSNDQYTSAMHMQEQNAKGRAFGPLEVIVYINRSPPRLHPQSLHPAEKRPIKRLLVMRS